MTSPVLEIDGPAAPPRDNGELVFAEPWESRAFGLAVTLHDGLGGCFAGQALASAGDEHLDPAVEHLAGDAVALGDELSADARQHRQDRGRPDVGGHG